MNLVRTSRDEHGFTLIELLIVITILGILAAVVVLSVGNLGSNAQSTACSTEKKDLLSVTQNYYATNSNSYANEKGLKDANLIAEYSTLFDVGAGATTAAALTNANATGASDPETVAVTGAAAYAIAVADSKCGTVGSQVYP